MRSNLPSGTVTFLFTDIEGSTKLSQQYPSQWEMLRDRHHSLLQSAMDAQKGYIFQVVGDAFCVAFSSASEALNAALDAQRRLFNEDWSPAPIKVRMGIHTGTVQIKEDGQYVGYTVLAMTQRIMSAGHGGQILLSDVTRGLVEDTLPSGTELLDLGNKQLKDLLRPERLHQLSISELPTAFPPLKTLDAVRNNLPSQLTTFIGRENEIAQIKQKLESHRLVTLTGAGGTGKTRLSLQVAAELIDYFEDGIWFVELAPLANPELLSQTILSTIGVREQTGKTPLEVLKEYLHEKQLLIVLDNCEHLVEASARVTNTLLKSAPDVKILASSREALGIAGEVSYPVQSLSLPDPKHLPAIEQLLQYEAVRLFIDRALLVSPHFTVDKETLQFIAQICFRLDGIPLAIELAAARVKILSVEEISSRLDDRFRLLTGGARTALPRQQTLRALIDWSYDLLSDQERLLLMRLAVFAGGWTLEAAEEICSGAGIESFEALDLLTQLNNKSLVNVVGQWQGKKARYRLLESIRQYSIEKLQESGEDALIHERHFDYYRQMIKQAELELFSSKGLIWFVWLEVEWDNLRAAVEWSLEKHPGAGLDLVNSLGYLVYQARVNSMSEMDNWLSQLVGHPDNLTKTAQRAEGLLHWAVYVGAAGLYDLAELPSMAQAMLEESLTIFEELSDKSGLAHGYLIQGDFSVDSNTGLSSYQKAVNLFRETSEQPWIAHTLLHIGQYINSLEYANRISYLEEALSIYRQLKYVPGIIEVLKQIGAIEVRMGNFKLAHERLDEGFSIFQEYASSLGNTRTMSYDLGDLAFYEGNYGLARKYYEDSLSWADENGLGSLSPGVWAKLRLAYLFSRHGEGENRFPFFREALFFFKAIGFTGGVIFTVEGIASLAVAQRKYGKAACLLAWANTTRGKSGNHRPPVEQASVEHDLAVIRRNLNDSDFSARSEMGSAMTTEQAIDCALSLNSLTSL